MEQWNGVGSRIRILRKQRGLTQEQLAEKIGRTVDGVSKLERGLSRPSMETLHRIAATLDTPVQDFFEAGLAPQEKDPSKAAQLAMVIDRARRMSARELAMLLGVMDVVATYTVQPADEG